jgi:hypothetical protein
MPAWLMLFLLLFFLYRLLGTVVVVIVFMVSVARGEREIHTKGCIKAACMCVEKIILNEI